MFLDYYEKELTQTSKQVKTLFLPLLDFYSIQNFLNANLNFFGKSIFLISKNVTLRF